MNLPELRSEPSRPRAAGASSARAAVGGAAIAGTAGPAAEELPSLLSELCLAFLSAGEHERAREAWAGLAAIDPEAPVTRQLAGMLSFVDGRYAAAEASYRRVLTAEPANRSARVFLAESLIAQRRWREAYELLDPLAGEPADDPAVRFAGTLRQGLASGLFQRGG